jgi:hypothetical protein
MSMSPIAINNWPGEGSTTFTFFLTKATLDGLLTNNVLSSAWGGQSQNVTRDQITEANFAAGFANAAINIEPNLLMLILNTALFGGGMTDSILGLNPINRSVATAERLYRGSPPLARSTVGQIVAAVLAAGS